MGAGERLALFIVDEHHEALGLGRRNGETCEQTQGTEREFASKAHGVGHQR
jgi:hypothetical protein